VIIATAWDVNVTESGVVESAAGWFRALINIFIAEFDGIPSKSGNGVDLLHRNCDGRHVQVANWFHTLALPRGLTGSQIKTPVLHTTFFPG
jgi:hypothetical protein